MMAPGQIATEEGDVQSWDLKGLDVRRTSQKSSPRQVTPGRSCCSCLRSPRLTPASSSRRWMSQGIDDPIDGPI